MRTKAIVAGAVLLFVLLSISIVFIAARPSPPPITMRHVQSGNQITATFEITNHTTSSYGFPLMSVEARNGSVWTTYEALRRSVQTLGPNGSTTSTIDTTNWPTGSPLRLRLWTVKKKGVLGTFLTRLKLRFLEGDKTIPLNPFDKKLKDFTSKPTEVVSDEFVVPEAESTSKANSEK